MQGSKLVDGPTTDKHISMLAHMAQGSNSSSQLATMPTRLLSNDESPWHLQSLLLGNPDDETHNTKTWLV